MHALGWDYDIDETVLHAPLSAGQLKAIDDIVTERIHSRQPAAYITGYTWFAGHRFTIDSRVLVPRSPIAELIQARFQPWLGLREPRSALEIGTGSACIALALALEFPQLQVSATDIDPDALDVARQNVLAYGLESRVQLHLADIFPPNEPRFDLIVSNPPYVPSARREQLPEEFLAEPETALFAGPEGFNCVDRIMRRARRHLNDDGLLVIEVGEIWPRFAERYARLEPMWPEFARGGEGIAIIEAGALDRLS